MNETERKYLGVTRAELRPVLERLGARPLCGPHFEQNAVYDRADGSLRAQKMLLRVRTQEWKDHAAAVLTFKTPLPDVLVGGRAMKRREETEVRLDDARAMARILEGLGYGVIARYEKIRESYAFREAHIDMDELPFGDVVEIEAPEMAILAIERDLGLDKVPTSAKNYLDIYRDWLEKRGLPPADSFVFKDPVREEKRKALGI